MIFGSFTLSTCVPPEAERIRNVSRRPALSLRAASVDGFSGGSFLNERLPHKERDVYYADEANDIVVLFSGAIFNKPDLQKLLASDSSGPDPWLIAQLFARMGPDFAGELNGDFSICILKPRQRRIFLFRDQVGVSPLAYASDSKSLWFSSDIIGLCRVLSDGRKTDADFLTGYFRVVDYRKSPDDRVRKLLPGHYLEFSEAGLKLVRYWDPEKIRTDRSMTHEQMLESLGVIVRDAIKIRCDSRFVAGAHVSGGIDSGFVATLVRREYGHQERFPGFSWSPLKYAGESVSHDERELVARSCERAGIIPVLSDMEEDGFREVVSSFHENNGYFSEDITSSQATAAGVNLLFSGWGGDEFISTAAAAIELDLLRNLKVGLYLRRNEIARPKKFAWNFLHYVLFPFLGILDRSTARSFRDDARYLRQQFKRSDSRLVRMFYFNTTRRSHHIGMLKFYHLQQRCESWYVMGFRKGLEYRYPLLDKRIIEFMLKVPSHLLCHTGLYRPLLRELGEGILPTEVRFNKSKNDPVYWSFMDHLYRRAAIGYMDEVDVWRSNTDMDFIDYKLLARDIQKFRDGSADLDEKVLFRSLIYMKAINDFTLKYYQTI